MMSCCDAASVGLMGSVFTVYTFDDFISPVPSIDPILKSKSFHPNFLFPFVAEFIENSTLRPSKPSDRA